MEALVVRALVVAAILAFVALAGTWWHRRQGRLAPPSAAATIELDRFGLADPASEAPRGLLLSTRDCVPCVAAREVLATVAADRPAFRWTTADAAEHLDVVRAHRIARVPTLLLVDHRGRVVARTSGVPRRDELLAALQDGR